MGPYDGQRFLFAVYVTFAPHRMATFAPRRTGFVLLL